ncbi:MAG TPA: prolipoprotein diacylglyceryl transferase family protein [Candidatus Acidoferrum sp.]|nr:prolipoprotein diacylglyceryl transferase family protein [Candidatus Acidoferrum sp.]
MPLAIFTFDFDPLLHLGDSGVRFETLGIAAAVLFGLLFAAVAAGRTPLDGRHGPAWTHTEDTHLRRDDLLFIVLGIVPGAVIGGRIGYVLLHLDFYGSNTSAIWDPSQGSLELGLAVVGGTLTGAYVARLLDAPVGRWLHAATGPVFLAIALGELARVLGGSGQGAPTAGNLATAYAGPGPWGSLAPAIPAQPSQLYGAVAAFVALVVVIGVRLYGGFRSHDGSSFFVALLLWALGRSLVTTTWRDDPVLGPFPVGGVIALLIGLGAVGGVALARWAAARERNQAHGLGAAGGTAGATVDAEAGGTADASAASSLSPAVAAVALDAGSATAEPTSTEVTQSESEAAPPA